MPRRSIAARQLHRVEDGCGLGTLLVPAGVTAGSAFTGSYDGLNFGSGGLAMTFAGFTLAGNVIGGALNGQGAPEP